VLGAFPAFPGNGSIHLGAQVMRQGMGFHQRYLTIQVEARILREKREGLRPPPLLYGAGEVRVPEIRGPRKGGLYYPPASFSSR
jgi:hypothetical protein